MNVIQQLEQEEMKRLGRKTPEFVAGDTVIVNVNVVEGERKRVQAYEGVVIAKRNRGINSSFIVRKISSGEGVERTFQLYSPLIASIEVKRKGDVRRLEDLTAHLESIGFERVPMVEDVAQFSVRGGIIDIYSFGMAEPVRLVFGDDFQHAGTADIHLVQGLDGRQSRDGPGGATTSAQFLPGFTGGNHWEVVIFEAVAAGEGEIVLAQRRPWEDAAEPDASTFKFTLKAS